MALPKTLCELVCFLVLVTLFLFEQNVNGKELLP